MRLYILYAMSFFLLSACGKPIILRPTQCIKIDDSAKQFTDVFNSVLDEFERQDPGVFSRDPSCVGKTVILATTNEGWIDNYCGQRTNENGNGYTINLCPTIRPTWYHLPIVLVHELGHTFGLGHSKDPSHVMFYSTIKQEHDLVQSVTEVLTAEGF